MHTDGGAFDIVRNVADGLTSVGLAQVGAARDLARRVDSQGTAATDFAIKAQEQAVGFAEGAAGRAFDLARSSAAQAFASSGDALGFTRDTFAKGVDLARESVQQAGTQATTAAATAGGAYQSAADTSSGNKSLIYVGLAVVGLVGVALLLKR